MQTTIILILAALGFNVSHETTSEQTAFDNDGILIAAEPTKRERRFGRNWEEEGEPLPDLETWDYPLDENPPPPPAPAGAPQPANAAVEAPLSAPASTPATSADSQPKRPETPAASQPVAGKDRK